ncbi:MAG: LD-carboxypeptidase [Victivallaceae bacterium]|nr:LD-carboxypeptidase [Victivallaceae bacterium]
MSAFKRAALIAPAGGADRETVAAAVEMLKRAGLQAKVMPHVFSGAPEGYLAADLKGRLQDLHGCWRDKSIDLIFCVRGGFGSAQLLPHIDWELLRSRRIPLIGFSDITALHMGMLRKKAGIPVAAPMPVMFREALFDNTESEYTRHFMRLALADRIPAGTELTRPGKEEFNVIKPDYALGQPVAATLSVLVSLCGTPWFPKLRHKILILEDINEPVYKLDRYLTQLAQCGVFAECDAVFFGQFTACGEEKDQYALFSRFAEHIRGAVLADFPFGHRFPGISLNMRRHLRLEKNGKIFLIDT